MGDSNITINEAECTVFVRVNPKVFSLGVVYATCYLFTDKHYVHLDGDPQKEITIELAPKDTSSKNAAALASLAKEFENELLKHGFYNMQHTESLALKTIMLKRILSMPDSIAEVYVGKPMKEKVDKEVKLLDNDPIENMLKEEDPSIDDPEGIAIPWEEKYGKQNDKKQRARKRSKRKSAD